MTPDSGSKRTETTNGRGIVALGCWIGALAIIWLVALPWWADRPATRSHLDWLRERQVDPSAMYYTELEAMKPILRELNSRQRGE